MDNLTNHIGTESMGAKVRVIVASVRPEVSACLKSGLGANPCIEMIINVSKMSEIENKLTRVCANALIIDMDTVSADLPLGSVVSAVQARFKVLTIYVSENASRALEVIKTNTVDFIAKPHVLNMLAGNPFSAAVCRRVEGFSRQRAPLGAKEMGKTVTGFGREKKIVVIASSTGGTNALEEIMARLPADIPPMLIVQHMPSGFTKLFAERLNAKYRHEIIEAQTGDYLHHGRVMLAPADRHMKVTRQQGKLAVECYIGKKIHGVMPAADILFESVAELVKLNAVGVVLTGMGADGARGLLQMHGAGAKTIGQNEATCVVYGMPKVAKELGAVDFELPLEKIAEKIMALV